MLPGCHPELGDILVGPRGHEVTSVPTKGQRRQAPASVLGCLQPPVRPCWLYLPRAAPSSTSAFPLHVEGKPVTEVSRNKSCLNSSFFNTYSAEVFFPWWSVSLTSGSLTRKGRGFPHLLSCTSSSTSEWRISQCPLQALDPSPPGQTHEEGGLAEFHLRSGHWLLAPRWGERALTSRLHPRCPRISSK